MEDSIFVKFNNFHHRIKVEDIDWIQSDGNYITIFVGSKKYVTKKSLAILKEGLKAFSFEQIHKRYVVNINNIKKLDVANNQLFIKDTVLPIGRTYKSALLNRFNFI